MLSISIAFIASLVITLFVLRYEHVHAHFTADHDVDGVQKFHARPVPRIGGLSVYVGIMAGMGAKHWADDPVALPNIFLLACALPAFAAGLLEDVTKRVGVRERLLATAFSAILGGYYLGAWLTRLDIPGMDGFLHEPHLSLGAGAFCVTGVLSLMITAFAVAGVANAFNIIDGYNGLAGVVAIISLLGLAYVANVVGDRFVLVGAVTVVGAIAGFLVWNYPNGLIFLGDGGAYAIGFLIAELSVLLVARNAEVSPWFPLLLSFYPIFETIFTIIRRVFIRRSNPGLPDAAHLHQLIYRRIVRWAVGSQCHKDQGRRNAMTSPYLWIMSSLAVIPAVLFWRNTLALVIFVLLFVMTYSMVYFSIATRKHPRWWVIRKKMAD
jgi:UDP-N-acetylmuramyl pentapeptide phosphotransferase/UDP-N-acetylglucosamine-1-phosphate transferase